MSTTTQLHPLVGRRVRVIGTDGREIMADEVVAVGNFDGAPAAHLADGSEFPIRMCTTHPTIGFGTRVSVPRVYGTGRRVTRVEQVVVVGDESPSGVYAYSEDGYLTHYRMSDVQELTT